MAFGGFSQGETRAPQSDINMVPLIDVMLVLLIVFMITAPLLTHSVKIDLPQASSAPTEQKPETVALSIDGDDGVLCDAIQIMERCEPDQQSERVRCIGKEGASSQQANE